MSDREVPGCFHSSGSSRDSAEHWTVKDIIPLWLFQQSFHHCGIFHMEYVFNEKYAQK